MLENEMRSKLDRQLIWWILIVCFAYHYKVIACGFFGVVCGYSGLCGTLLHGITTNHWFETLIYCPLMWYAMNEINETVFFPEKNNTYNLSRIRAKSVGQLLCAIYLFGMGIHITNTVEIYARVHLGIEEGALYEQIYWIDEHLSHWIQFGAFFLAMSWFVAFDRLDRTHGSYIAIFTGVAHGLERGIGTIEGNSAEMAMVLSSFIIIATIYRWYRHDKNFARAWADFFFRHGLTFALCIPLTFLTYSWTFGGFVQPSHMGAGAWKVVAFSTVFIATGFLIGVGMDRVLKNGN